MVRHVRRAALTFLAVLSAAGCGRFDEGAAAQQIRAKFCESWPYGCRSSLTVKVEDVRQSGEGRVVSFRLEAAGAETDALTGAYFTPTKSGWEFLMFEDPLRSRLERIARLVNEDRERLAAQMTALKAAQDWYRSIYRRYAPKLSDLQRVSYAAGGEASVTMTVREDGQDWRAQASGRFVDCVIDAERALPECKVRAPGEPGRALHVLAIPVGAP